MPPLSKLLVPLLADDPEIGGLTADFAQRARPATCSRHCPAPRPTAATSSPMRCQRGASAVLASRGTALGDDRRDPGHRRQSAPPLRPGGRAILRAAAQDRGRRHRHQRQDLGGQFHAPDLDRARPPGRQPGHARHRRARAHGGGFADDARSGGPAPLAGRAGQGRRHPRGDGSLESTGSTSSASTACRPRPRPSPISRTTISTITATWAPIGWPSGGCSPRCCRRAATAVINADSPMPGNSPCQCRNALASRHRPSANRATTFAWCAPRPAAQGQDLELTVQGHARRRAPAAGRRDSRRSNALCALGLVIATGGDADAAVAALDQLEGVPGRLQHVGDDADGRAGLCRLRP